MRAWRSVAILLASLSLAPVVGHLLELPAKMAYEGAFWLEVSQTLYASFGTVGAAFEVGALIAVVILAFLARGQPAFAWTAAAAVCLASAHAAYWIWLAPVNTVIAGLTPGTLPVDWTQLRRTWEYTHAARAGLQFAALAALVVSVVRETDGHPLRHPPGFTPA